ncbi:hypothetical protein ACK8OR_12795 [Jannaschia sp. KMU-145]|uniref:hypothetical protein n=1 Tax=Jannaschia halovivens TaxID=3388667 RepID=UPI00396AFEB1
MDWVLHRAGIVGGTYRGLLTGAGDPPPLELVIGADVTGHLTPAPVDGGWQVEAELDPSLLTEGTRTVSIRTGDGAVLDRVTVICGLDAETDLRAELDAMRDELDILKRSFRAHVASTE